MEAYTNLNKQYIAGEWTDGTEGHTLENLNPFDDTVLNTFQGAGTDDVDKAFNAAKDAAKAWRDTPPTERQQIMLKAASLLQDRKDEVMEWLMKEVGSTSLKAEIEHTQTCNMLLEAASFPMRMQGYTIPSFTPGKQSLVYRKALGVVAMISPWNFPLYLSMRTVAPALAVGNGVVMKPASQSPVTGGTFIARLFEEAGVPRGVLNVVVGKSSIIGDYVVAHPVSNLISFTGSTPVGKGIGKLGGEGLKKLALELGGNNPLVVLEDADVAHAVDAAIFGRFMHQGQICMSTNRILIHEKLHDAFLEQFVARAKALPYGDPAKAETVVGPLIDNKAVKRVLDLIDRAVKAGAKIETGGEATGNVVHPTVLSGVTKDNPLFQEEVFGPVVGLTTFKSDQEAIDLANATEYGLSSALHTKDLQKGLRLARQIEAGMVHINDQSVNDEMNTPFGGEKNSGIGRFGGQWILEELTTLQWVSYQDEFREYPF
ncbi:aldehyde dehydrogenase family protein [Pontibacter sp. E15-1]|uniref:aldehyde dehydrogenase family protein n=1 Tax=Pontibacter sp. E15-1 TaxID=2919918 RepID=UPI001F4F5870|nr:aldehyde dehydrogenase family protein [Pontibacter sp. E15-1]MCJ8164237.1 aldehyde dehydrogenase family protein [Pontibacter sp. E15-1]